MLPPSVLPDTEHPQEKLHPNPRIPPVQGHIRLSASCHGTASSSVLAAEREDLAGEPRRRQQMPTLGEPR